jgi:endonuclease YncB( thermonuclease family)
MARRRGRAWVASCALACAVLGCGKDAWGPHEAKAAGKERVAVARDSIRVDDGDSIEIRWPKGRETVRILAIDAPEVLHVDHDVPYAQPFGDEATGFLRGCLAAAEKVELLRSGQEDAYGRTLGYLFVNGRNYSVLAIEARLAEGPSGRFGDNGLPEEYAACERAAQRAGPVPFESPHEYRKRMRALSAWLKERGLYPALPAK